MVFVNIFYLFFDFCINVFCSCWIVRNLIMSNIMDIVLSQEVHSYNPRTGTYYLIYPSAMLHDFSPFLFIHHYFPLFCYCFLIPTHSHDEICMREQLFCLFQNLCMTNVKHIKDTVSIHSNWVVGISSIRLKKLINLRNPYYSWSLIHWRDSF